METLQSIPILWLILLAVLLYALWMIYYLQKIKKQEKKKAPPEKKCKGDVIGKSLFVLGERHSQPKTTVAADNLEVVENKDTFVASDVPEHPRHIAPEELDEVFGAVPEGESNEALDIDYTPESEIPDDEADDIEDDFDSEDESEDLVLQSRSRASGASFEEMGEAYRHVVHDPKLSESQKENTGRILSDLKHTDMFEAIVSSHPQGEDKVSNLIDTYLSAFHKKMAEKNGESPSLQGTIPENFNVRDFV